MNEISDMQQQDVSQNNFVEWKEKSLLGESVDVGTKDRRDWG